MPALALGIAHDLGDPDVECMALAQLGHATVRQGRVDEGVALLDEAMTVALGGESSDPLACGDACCTTLVVCDGLADLTRAAQWCEEVVAFTERRHFTPVQSWCRGIFGRVLVRAGEWERAERVLVEASSAGRTDARAAAGRCRWPCSPSCACGRAASRRPSGCSTASTTSPRRCAALVHLHLERGEHALAGALLERGDDELLGAARRARAGDRRSRCRRGAAAERLRALAERDEPRGPARRGVAARGAA